MAQKKLQRNEKKLYFCGVKINELNMNNSFFGISLNALTPLSPPSELQEIPVAIREQSGVLCFHSR